MAVVGQGREIALSPVKNRAHAARSPKHLRLPAQVREERHNVIDIARLDFAVCRHDEGHDVVGAHLVEVLEVLCFSIEDERTALI